MFKAAIFCVLFHCVISLTRNETNLFELNVLHVNDFHARFEETSDSGGTCKADQCIGGFSRLYKVITDSLSQNTDSLILNAGDNFQGTLWYNIFKWNVTQHFLNQIPFDAYTLGNHEFDDGIAGVVPFIKSLEAPVLVANIDDTLEPEIQNTYKKSLVVERNGKKIGIIGVILSTANKIARTENLKFLDESESVNAEAERLVREENVFTNIVLAHSGYETEQEIARKATAASKISLIVGGHTHTFLYTGEPVPGPARPEGPYPTIVKRHEDGKEVLVVQAYCFARYLGNITISYDTDGNCVEWSGNPIFLASDIEQDQDMNEKLEPWKVSVRERGHKVIGKTLGNLEQSNCRHAECSLGNFVTDAMVYSYTELGDETSWTYAALALYNTGAFRTTIESGEITYGDMMTAQPFENTLDVGDIQGKHIKEIFEFSMTPKDYTRGSINVRLLQTSGFRVVVDLTQAVGSRITSIKVRCHDCRVPIYEDLDLNKTYRLIVASYLRTGGSGFTSIRDNLQNIKVGKLDSDVFVDYLEKKNPIIQEIEGRIVFAEGSSIRHYNIEN